ncbi:unnamed protein product [Tuber aestivum]|uniref:RING-type domain-containing protein n=1 Tax=Tuber aestivum TaxID=59557 RepID=A0A292Q0Z2_9PEZI|nr:unnamed protein product [Tuber aestivum]
MPIIQHPNSEIGVPPASEVDPAQYAPGLSSATASGPSLLYDREPEANQELTAHSPTQGEGIPGVIGTGPSRVEEDGQLVENMLAPIIYEEPEPIIYEEPGPIIYEEPEPIIYEEPGPIIYEEPGPISTARASNIHSDFQENLHLQNEDESGDLQVMWYEGEEYYEEDARYGPMDPSMFLALLPETFATTSIGLVAGAITGAQGRHDGMAQTRAQARDVLSDQNDGDRHLPLPRLPGNITPASATRSFTIPGRTRVVHQSVWSTTRAPTFRNAAGEIDINLIPHAPRTDLPPPPPLVPLARLTEEPPASWFEGMSEDSRCPVLFQPDYVVEYSFPCGHALCRWCYEQISLVSDRPKCWSSCNSSFIDQEDNENYYSYRGEKKEEE